MKLSASIAIFTFLFSLGASACQCAGSGPLSPETAAKNYIESVYGEKLEYKDLKIIKYYPSLSERLMIRLEGTNNSCVGKYPDGTYTYGCNNSFKGDYLATLPGQNCEVKLRVKTNLKKTKVVEYFSTCD